MLLASEIISDVRRELLEYGAAVFWSDNELMRLLNRGQLDYVNRTRILEDSASINLTQGRIDYPLPKNWFSTRLVLHNQPNTSGTDSWKRLYPTNLEKVAQERVGFLSTDTSTQSRPSNYCIWNDTIYIIPACSLDAATTVIMFYKSKPSIVTNLSTDYLSVDDSLAEGITAYILWKAWMKEKESDLAENQKNIYVDYIGEGRRWLKKRSGDQRYRIDIDSPIPFDNAFFSTASNPLV